MNQQQIYFSHASGSEYAKRLIRVLKDSVKKSSEDSGKAASDVLDGSKHSFVFPHEHSAEQFDILPMLQAREIALVLAEVSEPSTGQGIELAWAAHYGIPIICVHHEQRRPSGALAKVTRSIASYANPEDILPLIAHIGESSS